jgi:hypothetical protein
MKKLLILMLILAPVITQAKVIATMPNEADGRIELTDTPVPKNLWNVGGCYRAMVAHLWGNGANDLYGCWVASNDTIMVTTIAGQRTYLTSNFTQKN